MIIDTTASSSFGPVKPVNQLMGKLRLLQVERKANPQLPTSPCVPSTPQNGELCEPIPRHGQGERRPSTNAVAAGAQLRPDGVLDHGCSSRRGHMRARPRVVSTRRRGCEYGIGGIPSISSFTSPPPNAGSLQEWVRRPGYALFAASHLAPPREMIVRMMNDTGIGLSARALSKLYSTLCLPTPSA